MRTRSGLEFVVSEISKSVTFSYRGIISSLFFALHLSTSFRAPALMRCLDHLYRNPLSLTALNLSKGEGSSHLVV